MRGRVTSRAFWVGFLGATIVCIVVGVGLGVIHLWTDHRALHDLAQYLNLVSPKINRLP